MARKRARDTGGAADTSDEPPEVCGECSCTDDRNFTFASDMEVVKGCAPWKGARMKDKWGAADAYPMAGVDAAISARAADQCDKFIGRELLPEAER